jgi:HAMP domain-containing protein
MSIFTKQLLLLLAVALLPAAISAWHSIHQIDQMSDVVATTAREQSLQRDRLYMAEKVADIGNALKLTTQLAANLLRQQQLLIEEALAAPTTGPATGILYSADVAQSPQTVADKRFVRDTNRYPSAYMQVNYEHPGFTLFDVGRGEQRADTAIKQLAEFGDKFKALADEASAYTLWHYLALDDGVGMVYPAHGEYPQDYDPRQREWYQRAINSDTASWIQPGIDATSGQPVLPLSAPLRDSRGRPIGATAIDLPLRQLLNFQSISQPWLNRAQLLLLEPGNDGELSIVASKEPLQLHSDWRTQPQRETLSGLNAQQLVQINTMQRGDSLLLDSVNYQQSNSMLAITALGKRGDAWLALMSPAGASEAAVRKSLEILERQRRETLVQYGIGTVLLASLATLIALLAARQFTAPLIDMSRTTTGIASGDLAQRLNIHRGDEVGELAQSIDTMADSIEQLIGDQEDAYRNMIIALTRALEKKDSYTAAHSGRVARYSLKIGERIGLNDETLEKLRFGAITHDLGKIGIADEVLNKPASLDDDEYLIMQQHPEFSKTILKPLVRFREYAQIAGSHHEHWDGSGYPDGLQGEKIPLLARIVGIADAWDAMTGDRIYRKGMSVAQALAILEREKDSGQFDPKLIRVFIELVQEELAARNNNTP